MPEHIRVTKTAFLPAVFALAALLAVACITPAQAQYEMDRNMTEAELNEIHREVEELYGENPGLPAGEAEEERIDPAQLQQSLPPAAAAAIPKITKTLQKIRQPAPQPPAAAKKSTPQNTAPDRRSPPAYRHKGSSRIR